MKLHESLVKQGCLDGTIEFEAHDRVPFFIVEGIPVIGEEEIECYSETYNGVQYVKMDSTHKNADGSFSGAEPTYSASMNQERQELWAEQYELVTVDQMKELRRLDAMTALEYREHKREQLEAESKPSSFSFELDIKGQTLQFNIDDSDRVDLLGQMAMGATEFEVHDVQRLNSVPYDQIELAVIMQTLATVIRQHKYPIDERIKALYKLPDGFTKNDVDNC